MPATKPAPAANATQMLGDITNKFNAGNRIFGITSFHRAEGGD